MPSFAVPRRLKRSARDSGEGQVTGYHPRQRPGLRAPLGVTDQEGAESSQSFGYGWVE